MRYTVHRKIEILNAIESGEITSAEAMQKHNISHEELRAWTHYYAAGGKNALRNCYPRSTNFPKTPR